MRRRLFLLAALAGALLLGIELATGTFPDWIEDIWHAWQLDWVRYKASAGSGGTLYAMLAGFLLGQGLFLAVRQLWRGLLRGLRGRLADLDAARDATTGLPSKYALRHFLERNIRWAGGDPSTRQVSLALLHVDGLEALNESAGTLRGTELLQAVGRAVRDAAVPLSVGRLARPFARWRLGPRLVLFARTPPSRCPARAGGATFALGFRGVDPRKAFVVARDLAHELQALVREREPQHELRVTAALVLFAAGATADDLERGARTVLAELSAPGEIGAGHEANDGSAAMLEEFRELRRVPLSFARAGGKRAPLEVSRLDVGALAVGWVKRWGLAAGCLAAGPIILSASSKAEELPRSYPWPDTLESVPVVDAGGSRSAKLVRWVAAPISDGIWEVESARVTQVEPETTRPVSTVAQVRLAIVNRSSEARRLSLYDIVAVDGEGRRIPAHPKASLSYADPLGDRTLEPGGRWTGWLHFARRGSGIRSLIIKPSRDSRLVVPLAAPPTSPARP